MSSTLAAQSDMGRPVVGKAAALRRVGSSLRQDPLRAAFILVLLLVLVALIVYPLALLLGYSFHTEDGGFGFGQFAELVFDDEILGAAATSFWFMLDVSIGCLLIGVPLAWLEARTNIPCKRLIRGGAAIAFIIPSFVNVIAWIFLLAPNSGYINQVLVTYFHLSEPPFDIFSFGGLVFIETAHLFPIVFFAVSAALANVDSSHEQAARILGAGRLRTLMTVTLPLVSPAIVSSVVLCMLDALSSFGAPAAIGTMANFSVLSTEIYQLLTFPPHLSLAAALSVPIAVYTLILLWVQQRYLQKNRFTTLTGKASAGDTVEMGAWRYPLASAVLLAVCCLSLLPMFALVALSLLNAFGNDLTMSNLVLDHYGAVFDRSFTVLPDVQNSLVLAVAAATLCVFIGMLLAWVVERLDFPGRGILVGIVSVAFGIPSIILGVGVMLGYVGVLYGTLAIILIAYVARHVPIAFVYVRSLIKQLSPELEEAARVSGAGWARTLKDIAFPILRPGAFVAWLLIFSLCLREQPMSAILTQSGTGVMSTAVLQFIEDGSIEVAAAIAVVIVVVSVTCLGIAGFLRARYGIRSRSH
jgi:iron(III) transport system permease protein